MPKQDDRGPSDEPPGSVQEIAVEVAEWLEGAELPATGASLDGPPIPIWDVSAGRSLSEAARNSGEWHHQIRNETGPIAYARSRVTEGRASIVAVGESPLVQALEKVLAASRGAEGDEVRRRLLRSERHHATWLWILRPGAPDEIIALQGRELVTGERFGEQSFLSRLAALPPPGMIAMGHS